MPPICSTVKVPVDADVGVALNFCSAPTITGTPIAAPAALVCTASTWPRRTARLELACRAPPTMA